MVRLTERRGPLPNRRFKFHKRRQNLVCTHNETLSAAAMRVNNPDRSAFKIRLKQR
jgi:hypothetical protein